MATPLQPIQPPFTLSRPNPDVLTCIGNLTNADIATFTRHAWGNNKDATKPAVLSEVRKELADRDTVFTSTELEKAYP